MALATIHSCALIGISAPPVIVEVHLSRGLPGFYIVGMPETAVKESRDRVRSAIINSGFDFPNRRIAVNLAPADLPKEGSRFDLPIAIGVLVASGQVPEHSVKAKVFVGELALSGALRDTRGSLVTALSLRDDSRTLVLPTDSAREAALVLNLSIWPVESLVELADILNGNSVPNPREPVTATRQKQYKDMSDVVGQTVAKKALEIAASGNHSVLMLGSPGSGKTMLAIRLPGIFPELGDEEALESAAIMSLTPNEFNINNWKTRPFRSPHHSASSASLTGGGSIPKPGEITRAHNGVLFLDELTEFSRKTLDALREPIESGYINISRVALNLRFPCKFLLVAAANPCKCGYLGDPSGICKCSVEQVQQYMSRLSGPLLDRIDIQLQISGVEHQDLKLQSPHGESSKVIQSRVEQARSCQLDRQGKFNSELSSEEIHTYCPLEPAEQQLLEQVFVKLHLSARGYHRILKLARTIADTSGSVKINREHLSLAINLRHLDRRMFGS
jgi:magnesium chelatase family protein